MPFDSSSLDTAVVTDPEVLRQALGRLVDRLGRLPERHWAAGYEVAFVLVQHLRELTMDLGDVGPPQVPRIAARAANVQVAVLGEDLLRCASTCRDSAKVAAAMKRALAAVDASTSALP